MSQQQADREVQPRPVGPPGVELELLKRAKVKMARVRKTRPTSTKNALSFSTTGTL